MANTFGGTGITAADVAVAVWDETALDHITVGSTGEQLVLAHEEARRARASQTNKVSIVRTGTGVNAVDNITVYDDDGITVLYSITVIGEDCDNRNLAFSKPYPTP